VVGEKPDEHRCVTESRERDNQSEAHHKNEIGISKQERNSQSQKRNGKGV
jgi:hypothetical protein